MSASSSSGSPRRAGDRRSCMAASGEARARSLARSGRVRSVTQSWAWLRAARRDVAFAIGTMALTTLAAVAVLQVWRADLGAPFVYRDDSVLNLMVVKSVLESGWYLENPRLGAPLGQELYDYPVEQRR